MGFLLWIQANSAPPLVGKLEYSGLVGVLLIAVAVLWRAAESKDAALREVLKEMLLHTEAVNEIAPALDRLRQELLAKLDQCLVRAPAPPK